MDQERFNFDKANPDIFWISAEGRQKSDNLLEPEFEVDEKEIYYNMER